MWPAPGRWAAPSSCSPSPSAPTPSPAVSVRVHPAMIPRSHPLAGVREAFNAVFVEAEAAGQLMFYGRGAGGAPTASAVLGDLVAVARNRLCGARGAGESAYAGPAGTADGRDGHPLPRQPRRRRQGGRARRRRRGVRASTTSASLSVRQEGHGDDAQPGAGHHTATDAALAATVDDLRKLDVVRAVASVMRVEGEDVSRTGPHDLARCDRGVPRPAAGLGRHARSSPCARAARRWSCAEYLSERDRLRGATSRSKAPTPPGRSRTAA